ncbi:radical SAM protein [Corallococcus sp. CA054B]|uniref:radical SAM protein n=1 Tax=Corallococcus sp. CA054B TaxID=2316734 RepID=UPI0011C42145|nr:radical SAM protein [Corallococcus sp. CA054B]
MAPPPAPKPRILLVQCGPDRRHVDRETEDFDPERGLVKRATMTPLACATLAALTPDAFTVDIWDEELHGQLRADTELPDYDIVGVSVMYSALTYQARFLGGHFRDRGATVVAGGPAISAAPEDYRGFFDALFVNEAERTWPRFLADWLAGEYAPEYRQLDKPSLSESPLPRWDAIAADLPRYAWGSVQTTRGCPFDCSFCDVIYLYGRKQRHKPVERVLDEVRAHAALGAEGVFFADDEFIGDAAYAKEVLAGLVPLNRALPRPLRFFTQVTMNLSRDAALLEGMADANFYTVVLGIESFDTGALKEAQKHQNVRADLVGDLLRIQAHGIGPRGSFIVGFDHDTPAVFDSLHANIQRTHLPWVVVAPLQAPRGTKLWTRLRAEGRLATPRRAHAKDRGAIVLNVMPLGMTRPQLLEGFRDLVERLSTWDAACERIRGFIAGIQRPPQVEEPHWPEAVTDRFLREATAAWALAPSERHALGDTLAQVRRTAPAMLPRAVFFLARNQNERRRHERLFTDFDAVLAAERQGDLVPDTQPVYVPPGFATAMRDVFPDLFVRLSRDLPDRRDVPEASRDVLVDFVARWGEGFQALQPQHHEFLRELCDREVAARGGHPGTLEVEEEQALRTQARRTGLLEALLKDVRDELASWGP